MLKPYVIYPVKTEAALQAALSVRRTVFIEEQAVPEELEIDEYDSISSTTLHMIAYLNEQPVGTGRVRPYTEQGTGKAERVAVLASERGSGLGRLIMQTMEEAARRQGYTTLRLNAQCHAQAFYEKLGYQPVGDVFDEAGIPHITMTKNLYAR